MLFINIVTEILVACHQDVAFHEHHQQDCLQHVTKMLLFINSIIETVMDASLGCFYSWMPLLRLVMMCHSMLSMNINIETICDAPLGCCCSWRLSSRLLPTCHQDVSIHEHHHETSHDTLLRCCCSWMWSWGCLRCAIEMLFMNAITETTRSVLSAHATR